MRARSSCLEEGELVLADLQLVAVLQAGRLLDPPAVQEGAVEASLVLDEEAVVASHENGVLTGHGDVVEEDVAVGRAADRRALALWQEVLAGTPPARADDECRPLGAEVLERDGCIVSPLLRRVAHRRLAPGLVLDEQRAATGAVIRGLRVLEAALRTVDVAHSSLRGAALPARIAASLSMSTCSRTP